MSERWGVTEHGSLVLRKYAIFDFKGILPIMWEFANANNYRFIEKDYTEKIKGDGSEIMWKATFERKVTSFIKSEINIDMWILRMVDVEVNGRKLKKGELEIVFDSYMMMDWQGGQGRWEDRGRWQSSKFHRFLRHVYIYYLRKGYFLSYAGKLYDETFDLYTRIKKHFEQLTP